MDAVDDKPLASISALRSRFESLQAGGSGDGAGRAATLQEDGQRSNVVGKAKVANAAAVADPLVSKDKQSKDGKEVAVAVRPASKSADI